jgi:hypothetical protein
MIRWLWNLLGCDGPDIDIHELLSRIRGWMRWW